MKRIFKVIGAVAFTAVTVYSVYQLVKFIKNREVLSLLYGIELLRTSGDLVVDISRKGVKFVTSNDVASHAAFEKMLVKNGYKKVTRYGRSMIYEIDGREIAIKHSKLFNRYSLFEVFNEAYFDLPTAA